MNNPDSTKSEDCLKSMHKNIVQVPGNTNSNTIVNTVLHMKTNLLCEKNYNYIQLKLESHTPILASHIYILI